MRRLAPRLTAALTSPRTRRIRRALAEGGRRLRREPHRVHYFHQVDDPYAQLAAQVLEPLCARFAIELVPHLVGPPSDAAAPERARLEAFARRDAADVAPGYGLRFPQRASAPPAEDVQLATRILAAACTGSAFAAAAPAVGHALWNGDRRALERLAEAIAPVDEAAARAVVARGDAERRRRGHYLGATFHYGGEWYWGVDRLHHLERRLDELGLRRPHADRAPIAPRPVPGAAPAPGSDGDGGSHVQGPSPVSSPISLEFFASLRSPYSYIAMERTFALARRLSVDLVLRPVLPMVMRGLPVPRAKRLYIVLDTKREAEDAGVPFGRIQDPVGRPVERCFSLLPWAREQGRAAELLLAFTRAAFAEGVDTGRDAGLRHVVERAGLAWSEARRHLGDEAWREELERNRRDLLDLGLWGVPSYRIIGPAGEPDYTTWGQDRLWRVEAELRRRLAGAAAPASAPPRPAALRGGSP